jgi:hypothetical protein
VSLRGHTGHSPDTHPTHTVAALVMDLDVTCCPVVVYCLEAMNTNDHALRKPSPDLPGGTGSQALYTGGTPEVHRMHTGKAVVHPVYLRCTSGVHGAKGRRVGWRRPRLTQNLRVLICLTYHRRLQ